MTGKIEYITIRMKIFNDNNFTLRYVQFSLLVYVVVCINSRCIHVPGPWLHVNNIFHFNAILMEIESIFQSTFQVLYFSMISFLFGLIKMCHVVDIRICTCVTIIIQNCYISVSNPNPFKLNGRSLCVRSQLSLCVKYMTQDDDSQYTQ